MKNVKWGTSELKLVEIVKKIEEVYSEVAIKKCEFTLDFGSVNAMIGMSLN